MRNFNQEIKSKAWELNKTPINISQYHSKMKKFVWEFLQEKTRGVFFQVH